MNPSLQKPFNFKELHLLLWHPPYWAVIFETVSIWFGFFFSSRTHFGCLPPHKSSGFLPSWFLLKEGQIWQISSWQLTIETRPRMLSKRKLLKVTWLQNNPVLRTTDDFRARWKKCGSTKVDKTASLCDEKGQKKNFYGCLVWRNYHETCWSLPLSRVKKWG